MSISSLAHLPCRRKGHGNSLFLLLFALEEHLGLLQVLAGGVNQAQEKQLHNSRKNVPPFFIKCLLGFKLLGADSKTPKKQDVEAIPTFYYGCSIMRLNQLI